MKYFSFLTSLVRVEKLLVILLLLGLIAIGWQSRQIKNQTINQQKIIEENLEKELLQKIQKLPDLLVVPSSETPLNQYDVFTPFTSSSPNR